MPNFCPKNEIGTSHQEKKKKKDPQIFWKGA
jgi:hypothetical protein